MIKYLPYTRFIEMFSLKSSCSVVCYLLRNLARFFGGDLIFVSLLDTNNNTYSICSSSHDTCYPELWWH